jgi:FkbM family methyltransferase
MLRAVVQATPISWFTPFRRGAVFLPRGSLLRSACVAILKIASTRRRVVDTLHEVRPLDRPEISFEPVDSMIMDAVYWFGIQGYEGVLATVWASLCRQSTSVLEIGGNVGFYSVIGGLEAHGDYTVVEPLPTVTKTLSANLRRNGIHRVVIRVGAAIAAADPRNVEISIPDEGRAAPVGAHLTIDSEVSGRKSVRTLSVPGFPFADLARGRDLIKIDAEGIEYELLNAGRAVIGESRPTIVVEVLPESVKLAALVCEIAAAQGYVINVVPAYGSDRIVAVAAGDFTSRTPVRYNSKDIVLSQSSMS